MGSIVSVAKLSLQYYRTVDVSRAVCCPLTQTSFICTESQFIELLLALFVLFILFPFIFLILLDLVFVVEQLPLVIVIIEFALIV